MIIWLDNSYNQQNLSKTEKDFKWYLAVHFSRIFVISDKAWLFMAVHSMAKGNMNKMEKKKKKEWKETTTTKIEIPLSVKLF